ncbi:DUF6580 family putative transport protein [Flectobacillus major]|jgi:hypothetical protein|uniref:DUF6580 family putative transport protein n=1 Tax=Flectobacillus major TaxID=103 RepID=UPI0004129ABE|nr:DUF6580 family putative transport protein [Flectobacillus major]
MKNSINLRFGVIAGMIAIAAVSRFLFLTPSLANFSPVGAMALFGGAYFANKRWAYALPVLALWLSNLVLNNVFYKEYYPSFSMGFEWGTFVSFAVVVTAGVVLLKKVTLTNLLAANVVGTLGFFIVSNLCVWLGGQLYTTDMNGLVECYGNALPFLRNTMLSNLLFSGVMFGAFELAKRQVPKLAV